MKPSLPFFVDTMKLQRHSAQALITLFKIVITPTPLFVGMVTGVVTKGKADTWEIAQ